MPLTSAENNQPVHIAIVGCGFCGTLTAIHLLKDEDAQLHIHMIDKGPTLAKGVAFDPHTDNLLLNVPNGRMSAFPDVPDDFMQWLKKNSGPGHQTEILATAFSPRQLYGAYLNDLWIDGLNNCGANKKVTVYHNLAVDITENGNRLYVQLENHPGLTVDAAILATGIDHQAVPAGVDEELLKSKHYFGDPWKKQAVKGTDATDDILVIGNGLTMVDTVIGLRENGFKQTIHTVSPRGYCLMRWHDDKTPCAAINWPDIIAQDTSLLNLFKTFNKHRKMAIKQGQSILSAFDSLRPHLQKIWQSFTLKEQQQFARYLRSHWGNIRHRLPVKMYDTIDAMRRSGELKTHSGKITAIKQGDNKIAVTLGLGTDTVQIMVQRIINCTGPESNIINSGNPLLSNLARKGLISPPANGIGINTDVDSYRVVNTKGQQSINLFAIGGNIKGMLWESTAVPELRVQAQKLAQYISADITAWRGQGEEAGVISGVKSNK